VEQEIHHQQVHLREITVVQPRAQLRNHNALAVAVAEQVQLEETPLITQAEMAAQVQMQIQPGQRQLQLA
jgi:hypothetical protein